MEDALRAPGPAPARARLRRVRAGHERPPDRPRPDPRFPPPVRGADAAHGVAGGRGAGARARRRVLRPPRPPPLSVGAVHPPAAPARLSRRARCLPRRVRARAAADEPGHRRLHPGLRRGRAAREAARRARPSLARVLVHGGVRARAAGGRPAHLRRGHRLFRHRIPVLARRRFAEPHPLRRRARHAHPLPHRRLPGNVLRDPGSRRAALPRAHRFRAALRAREGPAGMRARRDVADGSRRDAGHWPVSPARKSGGPPRPHESPPNGSPPRSWTP